MNELRGTYFNGTDSRKRAARLRWSASSLTLLPDDSVCVSIDLTSLKLDSPLPGAPSRLSWGGGESFVTLDTKGVAAMRRALALDAGWAARLERHMSIVLAAAILCVALLSAFAIWGVPALAARTAYWLPVEVSDQMADLLLDQLEPLLQPSELPAWRQTELRRYFASRGDTSGIRLEFRHAEGLGANAFTLSATTVAFTDDLVELADNDEELLAVYFHELGHARLLHVEQRVLSASAWLVMLSLLSGDIGLVGNMLLTSSLLGPAMSPHSRELEREADAYAVDRLLEAGISPEYFISILERLELHYGFIRLTPETSPTEEVGSAGDDRSAPDLDAIGAANREDREAGLSQRLLDYLSSHPPTIERIDYIHFRLAENR